MKSGDLVGPYRVLEQLGAGGMGEVYHARDSTLNRDVAIKVLPDLFAGDPERLARFEREAQTLAALNHPNIAQVFGFEKRAGHLQALVMELVEGPTLADRIDSGPLPLDEAIPIAMQVADALESAHDHSIIHRDLKPQNIKVRADGTVKILDFGLAKAIAPPDSTSGAILNSPTITTPSHLRQGYGGQAVTGMGAVLGTAAYMSPEQAKGRVVDRRADIWAFGCVLFEMLSGTRAFAGSDVSDVFVSIMRDEPRWSALPADTPPLVRSLVRRCLQKDLRKRLPHIGVARLELAEASTAPIDIAPTGRARIVWRAAAVAAIAALLAVPAWTIWSSRETVPAAPVRVRVDLGTNEPITLAGSTAVALSPDGRALAFVGRPPEDSLRFVIYVRHLDRLDAQQVPGTEGGQFPFFSPDGRWLAFFAQDTLRKVAPTGGAVVSICPAPAARGGSWGDDDVIVFSSRAGLHRVPAAGGAPEVVAKAPADQPAPSAPQILPRGRGVLYMPALNSDPATGALVVQPLAGGAPKEVMRGGRNHRYAASGHLTFVRNGTLFATPFDLDRLETRGEPVSVVEGVFQAPLTTLANLAISANGTLAYQPGAVGLLRQAPLTWVTQTGTLTPLRALPASFGFQRFSPDGRRLAMTISDGRESDIWVYDWERDILTRITTDPGVEMSPVWTPDGSSLVYGAAPGAPVFNLYSQRADGTGEATRLTTGSVSHLPDSFNRDGTLLVYHEGDPLRGRQSLMVLPLEHGGNQTVKPGTPRTLIGGAFLKANARVSPDGKWIAYAANDTGTFEIYVQPFPGLGQRVQVSNGGGHLAVWSARQNELYYVKPGVVRLMAVSYTVTGGVFAPARPRQWSQAAFSAEPPISAYGPAFDIHPDGERFAVTPPAEPLVDGATRGAQVVLIFNFFDELRRVAPIR